MALPGPIAIPKAGRVFDPLSDVSQAAGRLRAGPLLSSTGLSPGFRATQHAADQFKLRNNPFSQRSALVSSLLGGRGGLGGSPARAGGTGQASTPGTIQPGDINLPPQAQLPAPVTIGGTIAAPPGVVSSTLPPRIGETTGVPTTSIDGELDFRSLANEILNPVLSSLDPAQEAAKQRLEDAFRLAGGGSGAGSLQGPLLESIRRQEEGFARERGLLGAQTLLGALTPFITARGQDIGAAVTGRGQDITQRGQDLQRLLAELQAGVTQRGQTIGAGVTQRGQDVGALVSGRGQGLSSLTAQRGQDIQRQIADIAPQTSLLRTLIAGVL